jgi:HAD superfamily hydrolase (TIGR01549 family)
LFKNKNTFLFDLDGTLLDLEIDKFLEFYFDALSREFSDLCESREEFIAILMESTRKMIENDGKKSNQKVFMDDFLTKITVDDEKDLKKRFDHFYENRFPKLQKHFDFDNSTSVELINHLKNKDKKLVLATNPLFPKKAVIERLKWAGLSEDDFDFITSYENMNYAKPNPNYYQEILDKIDQTPEECLMIGNDMAEDTAAADLGIKTIIVDDNLIEAEDKAHKIDWKGSLKELAEILKNNI